ncbi:hypothetical protein ACNKHT_23760 [Shigella flexneri]
MKRKFAALGKGRSVHHRSLRPMDRDNRLDRVEKPDDLLTLAQGEFQADTAVAGLQELTLVTKTTSSLSDCYSCRRLARCGNEIR